MYTNYVLFLLIFFTCQTSNTNPGLPDSNPCTDVCTLHLYAASMSDNDGMKRTKKTFPECFTAAYLDRALRYAVNQGNRQASKRLSIEHYRYRLAENGSVIDKMGRGLHEGAKDLGSPAASLFIGMAVGSVLAASKSKQGESRISCNLSLIAAGGVGFASGLWYGFQQKQDKKEQSVMQRFEECVQQKNFKGVQALQSALYNGEHGFELKPCFKSKGDALITTLTMGSAGGLVYRGLSLKTKDNAFPSYPLSFVGAFGLGSYGGVYAGRSFKKWWTS